VTAVHYVNVTVPNPVENFNPYAEAYGSTEFYRGCDAAPSNITLQTFAHKDNWNTSAAIKTINVSAEQEVIQAHGVKCQLTGYPMDGEVPEIPFRTQCRTGQCF
jgi:hypothetical protein